MTKPKSGLMAMFDGAAYHFIHMLDFSIAYECWRVQPLFVTAPERDIIVPHGARITPIHSKGKQQP